jgi:hypothetical protein
VIVEIAAKLFIWHLLPSTNYRRRLWRGSRSIDFDSDSSNISSRNIQHKEFAEVCEVLTKRYSVPITLVTEIRTCAAYKSTEVRTRSPTVRHRSYTEQHTTQHPSIETRGRKEDCSWSTLHLRDSGEQRIDDLNTSSDNGSPRPPITPGDVAHLLDRLGFHRSFLHSRYLCQSNRWWM